MTEHEIRKTVAAMQTEQKYTAILLQRALKGEPGALFVIAAKRKQQAASKKLKG